GASSISRAWISGGRGGRPPQLAGFLIAQIQNLARAIRDGIVGPRGDLVFSAVEGPSETAAGRRNLKPKVRIGDHVDPRRGGRLPRAQMDHVFLALGGKPSQAVEEFEIGTCVGDRGGLARRRTLHRQGSESARFANAVELICEPAVARNQDDSRNGQQKSARLFGD